MAPPATPQTPRLASEIYHAVERDKKKQEKRSEEKYANLFERESSSGDILRGLTPINQTASKVIKTQPKSKGKKSKKKQKKETPEQYPPGPLSEQATSAGKSITNFFHTSERRPDSIAGLNLRLAQGSARSSDVALEELPYWVPASPSTPSKHSRKVSGNMSRSSAACLSGSKSP